MSKLAIFGGSPVRTKFSWQDNKYGKSEISAVLNVIKSGQISEFRGGPQVRDFEREYATYTDTRFAIATTSGTTALHAAISSLGLKKGNEVIVPAITFVSTASVLLQEQLKPIFADVDDTFCINPNDVEKKITKSTKAIIPVHLYGHPADMPSLKKLAKKYDLFLIEDAAQAHGAKIREKKVGSLGNIGCFSFFHTKNMSTGEGGMITTSDEKLYRKARLRREHGSPSNSPSWYSYKVLGYNYNMTEIQAAIGRVQLKKLDKMNKKRRVISDKYKNALKDMNFEWVKDKSNYYNVYHNFTILIPAKYRYKRDFIVDALHKEGIPVGIAYPSPLYRTDIFKRYTSSCPKSEDITSRLINLFTNPTLDLSLIRDIKNAFEKIFNHLNKIV